MPHWPLALCNLLSKHMFSVYCPLTSILTPLLVSSYYCLNESKLLHASTSANNDDGGIYWTATMVRHSQRATAIVGTETDWHWLVTSLKYCQIVWERLQSHRTRKNDREESVRWVWWRSSRDWGKFTSWLALHFPVSAIYLENITLWWALSHHYQGRLSISSIHHRHRILNCLLPFLPLESILAVIFSVLIQVLHTSSSDNHNSQLSFKLFLKKHILCSNYQ